MQLLMLMLWLCWLYLNEFAIFKYSLTGFLIIYYCQDCSRMYGSVLHLARLLWLGRIIWLLKCWSLVRRNDKCSCFLSWRKSLFMRQLVIVHCEVTLRQRILSLSGCSFNTNAICLSEVCFVTFCTEVVLTDCTDPLFCLSAFHETWKK